VRRVGVVTVSRSDYGAYLPVLRRIQEEPGFALHLIVAGMHLSPEFGLTIRSIEADGFDVSERVEMLLSSDTPEGISKSMGLGLIGFAQAYARVQPDIVLVLGDRFEMHAAASAALPFKIPLAHIHGGEISEGVFDDALRHSITKLSHLHFVSTEEYAKRVMQMGEEQWRVMVSGAPSLDNLYTVRLLKRQELEARFGLLLNGDPLLVTFHPVTLEYEQTEWQMAELLAALQAFDFSMIFTLPNADTNGRIITRMIEEFVNNHPRAQIVPNLGIEGYFSLMACAGAMVGNSSSGIIEAPSFKLPVVNIGSRQKGRICGKNVLDVGYSRVEVREAITRAISPEFRAGLINLVNPYGNGHAAEKIVRKLKEITLGSELLVKRFTNW